MASGAANLAGIALRLSDREFSIVHGVGFVIGITLLLFFLPNVLLVDPEFLIAGLFAGFVLGSPFEGFLSSMIGGGIMSLFWFVMLLFGGFPGTALITAILAMGNVTVGGLLGGFVGSRTN